VQETQPSRGFSRRTFSSDVKDGESIARLIDCATLLIDFFLSDITAAGNAIRRAYTRAIDDDLASRRAAQRRPLKVENDKKLHSPLSMLPHKVQTCIFRTLRRGVCYPQLPIAFLPSR